MSDFPLGSFFNKSSSLPNEKISTPKVETNGASSHDNSSIFGDLELEEISKNLRSYIKEQVQPEKYKAFFGTTFFLKNIDSKFFHFEVSSAFIKKMITDYYMEIVNNAVFKTMSQAYNVQIHIVDNSQLNVNKDSDDVKQYSINKALSVKGTSFTINDYKPLQDDLSAKVDSTHREKIVNNSVSFVSLDRKKLFSNFIVGPSNNLAHASAIAVSKSPGEVYSALYLHGNSGLGKTHLLHAIGNHIDQYMPNKRICIITANDFTNDMVEAIKAKDMPSFRRKYSDDIDVLMIDDVHELKNRPSTQNEFFHIFNELTRKKKQLLFTSDKDPKDINGLEDRIRTRLSSALVIEMQQPDYETRIAILRRKAVEENIYLPDDVINLIATCIKSNIRELEGSLIKLGAYSSVFNVDIDLETAKEQLNLNPEDQLKTVNMETITKTVSNFFRIPVPDIRSKARNKEIANARHIAMYFSYKIGQCTLTQIGDYFGKRDHTSVMHGVNKIKTLIKTDNDFAHKIFEIESGL